MMVGSFNSDVTPLRDCALYAHSGQFECWIAVLLPALSDSSGAVVTPAVQFSLCLLLAHSNL